jgi:hypothetical protein
VVSDGDGGEHLTISRTWTLPEFMCWSAEVLLGTSGRDISQQEGKRWVEHKGTHTWDPLSINEKIWLTPQALLPQGLGSHVPAIFGHPRPVTSASPLWGTPLTSAVGVTKITSSAVCHHLRAKERNLTPSGPRLLLEAALPVAALGRVWPQASGLGLWGFFLMIL